MRKIMFLLVAFALNSFILNATSVIESSQVSTTYNRGYGNSFIFLEGGIEFSVFPDGQFDFNILRNNSNLSVSIGTPNVNVSFNSGYDYNPYVQYDEFGAIIQIENIPIYYDYYGRVNQVGNVNINYNNYGYVSRVGGLYVHYNNYRVFSHCTGYINVYNRGYIYRPWHRYYRVPSRNHCIVYNRPYRQYYHPVRYRYERPFYNNYRPRTAVSLRHGDRIVRNKKYATVNRNPRNKTAIYNNAGRTTVSNHNNHSSRVGNTNKYKGNNNYKSNRNSTSKESSRRTISSQNNSRMSNQYRGQKNIETKKPNTYNSRTYHKSKTISRNAPKVAQQSSNYSKQRNSVSRPTRSNQAVYKNKSISRNNNTKSRNVNTRRF
ncbi:hypothetical protein [Gaetbulibacter saemankumensis]|uniref:hypothetical protein n=1 Tax=Gaetbulibacter saemankumensis TaxID=311208 RepID=UPI00040F1A88|nr:hypothetical protein [Gaetbulibacter saemankumensis]